MAESATIAQLQAHSKPKETALSIAVAQAEIPALNARNLIDAGVHFGHSSRNWNPRMKALIFGKKNGIHVINVKETLRGAIRARYFLSQIASAGLNVLVVGTKKQAADVVRMEAMRAGMPFVATRWLGGTLTNHNTIRRRLERLMEIERIKSSGAFERLSKKQQSVVEREHKKIAFNLEGLRDLEKLPAAMFVVDVKYEKNAVAEARKLNIPIVGIVDTDSNPEVVDIAIPANDDSLRGIQIILHFIMDGLAAGKQAFQSGSGLKDKSGLQVSTYEDLGPTGRDKRRTKKDGRGGGGRGRRSGGDRSAEAQANVQEAVDEASQQAASQTAKPKAAVRVKPGANAPRGDHKPHGDKPHAAHGAPAHTPKHEGHDKPQAPKHETHAPKHEAKGEHKPNAEHKPHAPKHEGHDKPKHEAKPEHKPEHN